MAKVKAQIIVATFNWINDAEMAKMLLEAESIQAEIFDSGITSANPLLANAVGGIKLKVNTYDANRAIDILKTAENENKTTYKPWCPNCDSENVEKKEIGKFLKVISVLTLGIVSLVFVKSFYCKDCGYKWN